MLWIGLTGGIATGKSTVSRLLREKGYPVVDADLLAREAVQIGTKANLEITRVFGPDAVLEGGELNRARIGQIVFSDPAKRLELEAIIHPEIRRLAAERRKSLSEQGVAVAFYDVPLLFEKNMQELFDQIVVVASSPELQKLRMMARDGFSAAEADKRLSAQLPIAEKVAGADFVIENESTLEDLKRAVERYAAQL